MEKSNFYQPQNKKFTLSESNTNALIGMIGQIGSSYFNSQNQPGYQPSSPTYNVYQLPGNSSGSGSSNQTTSNDNKKDNSKIFGLDASVIVVLVILIIAIIGALLYFKKPA